MAISLTRERQIKKPLEPAFRPASRVQLSALFMRPTMQPQTRLLHAWVTAHLTDLRGLTRISPSTPGLLDRTNACYTTDVQTLGEAND